MPPRYEKTRTHVRAGRRSRKLRRALWTLGAVGLATLAVVTWVFVLQSERKPATALQSGAGQSRNAKPAGSASPVTLPADDGPHRNSTEWWYYNGHLKADSGQVFAYHVAVFLRRELSDHTVFHVSLVDVRNGKHYSDQARTAGIPSQAAGAGFDFRYPGWEVAGAGPKHRLDIRAKDFSLALDLSDPRPPTLHQGPGSRGPGLLDFGPAGESYYYSRMRMPSRGTLVLGGTKVNVSGQSWFDHQWGDFESTALKWNWFALQLDDGTDIMLYEVFDAAGKPVRQAGTLSREGRTVMLGSGDYALKPLGTWTSPDSGVTYPVAWNVALPGQTLALSVKPFVDACEFNGLETVMKRYWEGPVQVTGSQRGRGYLELSGYVVKGRQ